jgi:DNA replication protein DnaC
MIGSSFKECAFQASQSPFTLRQTRLTVSFPTAPPNKAASARRILAELELIDRERRMVERRIRAARFPAVKSFDTFDFTAIPCSTSHSFSN